MGQYLLCVIEEKGCYMDKQVFYADETGLFLQDHWQMNLYNSSGLQTSDFKPFRDRAAMLLCASAKGNFKSKPLRVYRVRNPWAFKGRKLNHMPFIEGGTKKAWMVFEILSGCLGLVPQLLYPRSCTPSPEWKPEYLLPWRTQMCPSECSSFYAPKHCVSHPTIWSGQNESFQDPLHESLWDSPHEGNTMMDSWKSVTIRDTIGHVGAVQGSIQQAPVKNCWEMFDQTAWKISKSLKVLQKKKKNGDKNKHLPHTNKWRRLWGREGRRCGGSCGREASRDPWWRPGQRTRQGIRFSDESQLKIPKCCPSLTAAQITRWNSALGRVVSDVEECGPESEQSLTLKHHCVCTLHQDLMWKRFEVNSQANKAD